MELNPPSAAPSGFPISEKKARAGIGLSRDEIRALRSQHLTEGTHFTRGKQQSVWLTQAGLDLLTTLAGANVKKTCGPVTTDDLATSRTKLLNLFRTRAFLAPPVPSSNVHLRVVNCTLKNLHLLLACPLDDDPDRPKTTVRVRVRSTLNFVRHMEIPARLVDGYTDLYDLARSCPRKKGAW